MIKHERYGWGKAPSECKPVVRRERMAGYTALGHGYSKAIGSSVIIEILR